MILNEIRQTERTAGGWYLVCRLPGAFRRKVGMLKISYLLEGRVMKRDIDEPSDTCERVLFARCPAGPGLGRRLFL